LNDVIFHAGVGVELEDRVAQAAAAKATIIKTRGRDGRWDAAVWGVQDRNDIIWLTSEHYSRGQSLRYYAEHLPRDVMWYADPTGACETLELRKAGLVIRSGDNDKQVGIQAVRARLEEGTLKVVAGSCPNLLAEATLYRYATDPAAPRSRSRSTTTPWTRSAT
jgi:hypothetical protein